MTFDTGKTRRNGELELKKSCNNGDRKGNINNCNNGNQNNSNNNNNNKSMPIVSIR